MTNSKRLALYLTAGAAAAIAIGAVYYYQQYQSELRKRWRIAKFILLVIRFSRDKQ
jgi:high-affinity Fe2+/Pb2+ permease